MSDTFINIPSGGAKTWKNPVVNAAALPLVNNNDGDVRATLDTHSIYIWDGASWILVSSGTGGINSIIVNGPLVDSGTATDPVLSITSSTNTFAGFDGTGNLESIPGFNIDTTSGGMNVSIDNHPDNVGDGETTHQFSLQIEPLQDSPNDTRTNVRIISNVDSGNSGFNSGNVENLDLNFNLTQTGSAKSLTQINMYNNIGDSTDPVTITSANYVLAFGDYNDGLTLDGQIQGYSFQPHLHSGLITTNNTGINAFSDFSNIDNEAGFYTSFNAGPNIANVLNNRNYEGLNIHPNITTLTGNAGFNGVGVYGNIGTMSATGNVNGYQFSPNITTSHGFVGGMSIGPNISGGDANFAGVQINPHGTATLPNVRGVVINLNGIATSDINGPIALETDSRLSVNATTTPTSGQAIQIGSRIEHLFQIPAGFPLTGTDILGLNLAGDLLAQDNMSIGPIGIGFSSVGFIADMGVAVGKTVDLIHVFLPAVALPDPGFTTGGTVTTMEFVHIQAPLPQGGSITTTNLYGLRVVNDFSTTTSPSNVWGISVDDANVSNFLASNLAIGTSTKKVSNGDVALEIGSPKAFILGQVTTIQKLALTALSGMQVYDTTLNQMSYYNGTIWINF